MDRRSPPLSTRDREHVLSLLKKVVHDIQSTDRQLTDLVIPQSIYDYCRRFAEEILFEDRYEILEVFEILQEDSKTLNASEAEVNKMKKGLKSLLRYPLNLLVAPNRPELKIIKASTSFFMFQVKRNLKNAHSFLDLMGYNRVRNATDLSLSKSFSIDRVYTLVLDIVILHEELEIISFLISQSMTNDIKLYHYFIARCYGPSDKQDCLDYIRKGEATRKALSLEQYPPSSSYSLTTTDWDQGYREHSTGQSYHNNDYRDYRDERYDNTDYRFRHDDDRGATQGYYYHEDEQRRYHYESGHYQYRDDQYQYRDQYYQNQHDRDHRSQYQYQDDRYQHQYDDAHFRDQRYDHSDQRRHVYNKDERFQRHEDQEQSKRREVECDGGQFVNDVSTSQRSNDTATYMRPEDSISGMPPPMFNAREMMKMFKVQSSTPRKEVVASDDLQPHSLNHSVSKSDSFDEQLGINYERRTSSTPSFRSDSSYTDNMYRPFEEQPVVFSPSQSVKFTITEETESERNEDEMSSRSSKPRRNNPPLGAAGSTNSSSTWSGTNADREVIRRPFSKDDSVLEGHRRGSYTSWICTFCSNENYGRNTSICEACNQERASLHSH